MWLAPAINWCELCLSIKMLFFASCNVGSYFTSGFRTEDVIASCQNRFRKLLHIQKIDKLLKNFQSGEILSNLVKVYLTFLLSTYLTGEYTWRHQQVALRGQCFKTISAATDGAINDSKILMFILSKIAIILHYWQLIQSFKSHNKNLPLFAGHCTEMFYSIESISTLCDFKTHWQS